MIFKIVDRLTKYSRRQELKLAKAIAVNDAIAVKNLLERGTNPNALAVGQNKEPIIFLAFEKVYFTLPQTSIGDRQVDSYYITAKKSCLRLLLEYGADPKVRNTSGRTALEIAIVWCMPEIVKLLLLNGADPNARGKENQTPLMKAVILGIQDARPTQDKLAIIKHLIDSGAAIDAQNNDGKTALMCAVGNSRLAVVELLLSSGASLVITDNQGNKACDEISSNVTPEQKAYLQRILTQP